MNALADRCRSTVRSCSVPLAVAALLVVARAQEPAKPASEPAKPVFADGQAQVVKAFADPKQWVQQYLWVETTFDSDGDGKKDRMHVAVTRPQQTETEGLKVPAVYETSPYFCGIASDRPEFFWDPHQELGDAPPPRAEMPSIPYQGRRTMLSPSEIRTWVPRGFAVVHSSSPGTGRSQGCPSLGGDNESLAPKAVIDWLNGRAPGFTTPDGDEQVEAYWCTGKVGMIGTSYNGTLPIAAATTGVEGLEAVIPIAPNTSYWHYYRSNGLVRHPGGYMGEDIDVLYDFINSGDPSHREYCNRTVRDGELRKHQDRRTGDYNEFWKSRDYLLDLGPYRAATLMAHGFNDWNVMPEHTVRIDAALKQKGVPCMAYFHQGAHGGPPPLPLMNRWFTRFLYGVENGVEKEPRAWIVREGDPPTEPTAYPDYPHPDAAPVTLHLRRGGRAVGGLAPEALADQGKETLVDDVRWSGAQLAAAKESPHRLLYATPELQTPLHLSGTAKLRIKLACSRKATNLSVWLVSLPWEAPVPQPLAEGEDPPRRPRPVRGRRVPITNDVITRGWADPQNWRSMEKSEPLEPGRFYELAFDLQPDDQVLRQGERIALMIFASDQDFTLWPKPGTELTVDLDATSLELPVVGGATAFAQAIGTR